MDVIIKITTNSLWSIFSGQSIIKLNALIISTKNIFLDSMSTRTNNLPKIVLLLNSHGKSLPTVELRKQYLYARATEIRGVIKQLYYFRRIKNFCRLMLFLAQSFAEIALWRRNFSRPENKPRSRCRTHITIVNTKGGI